MLFTKRVDKFNDGGKWGLCGGKLEDGETWEQGCKRELFEETGLECETFEQLGWINYIDGNGDQWLTLFVKAINWKGVAINKEEEKCSNMMWFPITALPRPLFEPLEQFIEKLNGKI